MIGSRRGAKQGLVLAALAITSSHTARAYRPFDGTDADVAGKGEVELELGPVGYLHAAGENFVVAPAVVFNLGLIERWELVLQGNALFLTDDVAGVARARIEDTGLFLKHVLREGSLQGKSGPSLATEFGVLLPTLGGETSGAGLYLGFIASQRWRALTLHFNLALAREVDGLDSGFAGLIVEGPSRWRLRPVMEVFYSSTAGEPGVGSVLAGAIGRMSERLSFDFATRAATTPFGDQARTFAFEVRAGFTWGFDVF